MNPNVDSQPSMPMPEQLPPAAAVGAEQAPQPGVPSEQAPASVEHGQQANPPQTFTVPSVPPTPPPSQTSQTDTTLTSTPSAAADSDKIELEWVLKAKQIVAATRDDPYQQNRQLAAIKADYMRKRYNKTVKLSE